MGGQSLNFKGNPVECNKKRNARQTISLETSFARVKTTSLESREENQGYKSSCLEARLFQQGYSQLPAFFSVVLGPHGDTHFTDMSFLEEHLKQP